MKAKGAIVKKKKLENLIVIKTKLAEKYERLAKVASSVPKKVKFQRTAAYFRYQIKMLGIKVAQA